MPSNIKLKDFLKQAIIAFYNNDKELIQNIDGLERTCVFKIATYLDNIIRVDAEFNHLHLDCEYNKSNTGPKMLGNQKVQPDLIIHQRNLNNLITNPYNTLVVEFKGWWNDNIDDIEKLKKFTSSEFEYEYQLGIFVKLGRTAEETIFQYFKNGQEVLENDF